MSNPVEVAIEQAAANEPTVREEWLITGEPSLSPNALAKGTTYPSYRFVCGGPHEFNKEGTPEDRAREFVAGIFRHDPTGWGGTIRLQSRVITEMPWKDELPR